MSSAAETYKKILNIFFIILLIILLCIAGYVVYRFISAKIINDNSDEYIAEFTNEIGDIDSNIISDDGAVASAQTNSETNNKATKKGCVKKQWCVKTITS